MDDAVPVQVRERAEHLHEQVHAQRDRLRRAGLRDRAGVLLQVHREIRLAVLVEPVVEDADDVRVPQRGEKAKLLRQQEPLVPAAVGGRARDTSRQPETLQGDDSPGESVERPIDRAHSPVAELVDELIARADGPEAREGCGHGSASGAGGRLTGGRALRVHPGGSVLGQLSLRQAPARKNDARKR